MQILHIGCAKVIALSSAWYVCFCFKYLDLSDIEMPGPVTVFSSVRPKEAK